MDTRLGRYLATKRLQRGARGARARLDVARCNGHLAPIAKRFGTHAQDGRRLASFVFIARDHAANALHQRAAETVVLATADKLGAASAFTVAPLKALAGLVVPAATPARVRNALKAAGAAVSVAQA